MPAIHPTVVRPPIIPETAAQFAKLTIPEREWLRLHDRFLYKRLLDELDRQTRLVDTGIA